MSLRSEGKTSYLYLGRGKGYEGFWVGEGQIPSSLRKKDQFLEYLRKHLSGVRLLNIRLDSLDRIVYIDYQKFGKENSLGLFYNARQLYFANKYYDLKREQMRVFTSWAGALDGDEKLEDVFNSVGRTKQNQSTASGSSLNAGDLLAAERDSALKSGNMGKKKNKFLKRKARNIEQDLKKTRKWTLLKDWLDQSDDLEKCAVKVEIHGIKIKFKEKEHYKRRDEVYKKIKKLKKGLEIQTQRLKETLANAERETREEEELSLLAIVKPLWKNKETRAETAATRVEDFKTIELDSIELGVGVSAKGNDQLRKTWASKEDWWFHLEQGSSPHIVAKLKGASLSPLILQKVARTMKKTAKVEGDEINLIYTQVKNLKGIPKRAGSVTYKKEKRIRIYVENEK